MREREPVPDITVDARGALCPQPIIDVARVAATSTAGARIRLLTDDPAAAHDVPAWCRMRGHRLESAVTGAEHAMTFDIVLGDR